MQAFNSYLGSTVHVAHAHRMRGQRWADDPAATAAMQRKVPQSVAARFESIEHDLSQFQYCTVFLSATLIYSPWRGGSKAIGST